MTKLTFKLGRYDEALTYYKTLLTYTKKAVTRNVAEKAINRVLDYVSADEGLGLDKMQEFYEITMKALEEQKNDVSLPLPFPPLPSSAPSFPSFLPC
jgi:COP9 signalosome complex subunit 2